MPGSPITPVSADVVTVQREYQKWDSTHSTTKDKLPCEGRDYLRHAQNLFPFLEAIAEINPLAKGECYTDSIVLIRIASDSSIQSSLKGTQCEFSVVCE